MFIKTVVIDGFKSYAQRTEVSGFDRSFNAITGLNGSGKSNILDSICFLLGISNLLQVRLLTKLLDEWVPGLHTCTRSLVVGNNFDPLPIYVGDRPFLGTGSYLGQLSDGLSSVATPTSRITIATTSLQPIKPVTGRQVLSN